ncbi:MAG: ABC transporter ATP-binding protein [Deltaproteobacteria bacterium]|nr:ABC transporter ATP-binding protein [Deltaproteobacteria bacterium]
MASTQNAYSYVFGILGRNKRLLALSTVVALIEAGLLLVYPWFSRLQIETLEGKRSTLTPLLTTPGAVFLGVVVLILLTHLATTFLGAGGRLVETYVRERMGIDTDRVLYDKMERLDAGFLENPKNRRLIYIFFDISILPNAFVEFSTSSVKTVISIIGILPIIALTDLRVCGVIMGFGLIQVWLLRIRMRKENAYRLYKERAMAGINELIFLLRHRFHQLLGSSGEARIMPKFWEKRREALSLEVKQTKIAMTYELLNHLIENLSLFGAAIFVGWRVLAGEMTVGAFVMVTLYTAQLQSNLSAINMNIGEWYRLRSIFLQLGFFLTMQPRVALEKAEAPSEALYGDLLLEDVCFRYPHLQREEQAYIGFMVKQLDLDNAKRDVWPGDYDLVREWKALLDQNNAPFAEVLRGATCQIRRGEITALVGRNGSGKTTLTKLLVRNYDPDRGMINLSHRSVKTLTPRYLRHLFSIVTQEPFLLDSFSIRDNVLLGCDPACDDTAIWEIFERLDLKEAIRAFPGGLDSLIGDEVSLSGGQSQLLVIARTLLQRRPFVILDEGTNQLDAEHELAILQILDEIKKEATVMVITHRMTTARKANKILVLDDGRVVEEGTHNELIARAQGLYRHFWEIQVVK